MRGPRPFGPTVGPTAGRQTRDTAVGVINYEHIDFISDNVNYSNGRVVFQSGGIYQFRLSRRDDVNQGSQKLLKNLLGLVNFEKRTAFH